ncbi:MAG: N-acyl homoserine lactonase family protein [Proteobacteria bacterium]|nr:N-acyl homoserine lactonase family protein [Pseudomonadota bacterium]
MTRPLPAYELYAIRYATREARRAEHFIGGDPHEGPMAMDYYVWVAVSPERVVLIDLGFSAETAAKRRRQFLGCPIEALRLLDIQPEAVRDVILTHLHYDHAGNFALLPAAEFHLQEPEMQFATGRHIRHKYFSHGFEVEDIVSVVRLNYAKRVRFYNGPAEVAPGLMLEPAPGHTVGQQTVRVHTRRGWVVLASDAAHYYENIGRGRPYPAVFSAADVLDTYEKLLSMASGLEHIIPGHDPLVMQVYPAARPGLEGKIARLDVAPKEIAFGRPRRG